MTDKVLETAFEKMAAKTNQMWLDDIKDGYYQVVKQINEEELNPEQPNNTHEQEFHHKEHESQGDGDSEGYDEQ